MYPKMKLVPGLVVWDYSSECLAIIIERYANGARAVPLFERRDRITTLFIRYGDEVGDISNIDRLGKKVANWYKRKGVM